MKQNIFIIGYDIGRGDEDVITAYWSYLLDAIPGLGQAFIDHLAAASGLPPTQFLGCLDHPAGDASNHPDLLVQGRDWQVLFEHKVSAALGPEQLERYLALALSRGWKLSLMADTPLAIGPEVLASPAFLRPSAQGRAPHFVWSDLLPLLRGSGHHLAIEFAEFLEYRGLGTFSWGGRGDPFFDEPARSDLLRLYDAVGHELRAEGTRCAPHPKSLIYKVSTPHSKVHLLNFGPRRSVAQEVPDLRGPVMAAWFWMARAGVEAPRCLLESCPSVLGEASMPITLRNTTDGRRLPYAKHVVNEREYYVPLDVILVNDLEEASRRLVTFIRAALEHVRMELDERSRPV